MTASFGRRNLSAVPPRPVEVVPVRLGKDQEARHENRAVIVAAVVGVLLFVVVGSGMYYLYNERVRHEEAQRRAALEREKAEAIAEMRRTMRSAMMDIAKANLKDPDSAQFSEISFRTEGDTLLLCGNLNARNSYGGYVGKKAFYVRFNTKTKGTDVEMEGQKAVGVCE